MRRCSKREIDPWSFPVPDLPSFYVGAFLMIDNVGGRDSVRALYNRKRKRWERTAPCGRVIWSKKSCPWMHANLSVHIGRCWKCNFLARFDSNLKFKSLMRLVVVGNTQTMTMVGYADVHSANAKKPQADSKP
jgi:hypothetical protein